MGWAKSRGSFRPAPPWLHTPGLQPRDGDVTVRAVSSTRHVQRAAGYHGGPSTLPMVGRVPTPASTAAGHSLLTSHGTQVPSMHSMLALLMP